MNHEERERAALRALVFMLVAAVVLVLLGPSRCTAQCGPDAHWYHEDLGGGTSICTPALRAFPFGERCVGPPGTWHVWTQLTVAGCWEGEAGNPSLLLVWLDGLTAPVVVAFPCPWQRGWLLNIHHTNLIPYGLGVTFQVAVLRGEGGGGGWVTTNRVRVARVGD